MSQCKYDFCWICLEEWKKHSSSTGGYYRCTRYEVIQQLEEQSKEMTVEVLIQALTDINRICSHRQTYSCSHFHSKELPPSRVRWYTVKVPYSISFTHTHTPSHLSDIELFFITGRKEAQKFSGAGSFHALLYSLQES